MGYSSYPATVFDLNSWRHMTALAPVREAARRTEDEPAPKYGRRARARLRIAAELLRMKVYAQPDSDE